MQARTRLFFFKKRLGGFAQVASERKAQHPGSGRPLPLEDRLNRRIEHTLPQKMSTGVYEGSSDGFLADARRMGRLWKERLS